MVFFVLSSQIKLIFKDALRPYDELICCHVGNFENGNSSVYIKNSNGAELLWEEDTPLTGFTHIN